MPNAKKPLVERLEHCLDACELLYGPPHGDKIEQGSIEQLLREVVEHFRAAAPKTVAALVDAMPEAPRELPDALRRKVATVLAECRGKLLEIAEER
jgi:DNA-directed RNA polymerase subunit F